MQVNFPPRLPDFPDYPLLIWRSWRSALYLFSNHETIASVLPASSSILLQEVGRSKSIDKQGSEALCILVVPLPCEQNQHPFSPLPSATQFYGKNSFQWWRASFSRNRFVSIWLCADCSHSKWLVHFYLTTGLSGVTDAGASPPIPLCKQ